MASAVDDSTTNMVLCMIIIIIIMGQKNSDRKRTQGQSTEKNKERTNTPVKPEESQATARRQNTR